MPAGRIEICGGIAAGKTTLARLLESEGFYCVYEDFRSNPFWSQFYNDPAFFAFETEVSFTLQHYSSVKSANRQSLPVLCDFSLLLDHAYAHVSLTGSKLATYLCVIQQVLNDIGEPALVVNLECSAKTELARIRARARDEEAHIRLQFLHDLNIEIQSNVNEMRSRVRVLDVDSDRINFAADRQLQDQVRSAVVDAFALPLQVQSQQC